MNPETLKYPIGTYQTTDSVDALTISNWASEIELLPTQLRKAVEGLDETQLNTEYRSGGWMLRQVVHHLADSHLNSQARMIWILTEDHPTIKPYNEAILALQPHYSGPIEPTLDFIDALHARWVYQIRVLSDSDLKRSYHHPESGADYTLAWMIGQYAWHGKHHVAHITSLRQRMAW